MTAGVAAEITPEVVFFCLAAGALLGTLFCALKLIRLGFGFRKFATALLDVFFCIFTSAAIFICELAINSGRLRLLDMVLFITGGLSAYLVLDSAAGKIGKGMFGLWSGARNRVKLKFSALRMKRKAKKAVKKKNMRKKKVKKRKIKKKNKKNT